jgi:hypothetical protein
LVTLKRLYYKDTGENVPLAKMVRAPFLQNLSLNDLNDLGLALEENTPLNILAAVQEAVEKHALPVTPLQLKAKNLLRPNCHSFGARGNLSLETLSIFPL